MTTRVDGVPHRVLRTELVEQLESTSNRLTSLPKALANAQRFKGMTGVSFRDMWREGNAMRRAMDLSWSQMIMAANTPMLLKAGLVDGNTESGVLASGQVVGVLDDLPSCDELVARIMSEAETTLARLR